MMFRRWILALAVAAAVPACGGGSGDRAETPPGRAYYVRPGGSDSNPGTSPELAWRSLNRLALQRFEPGDAVLFEGGRTFTGSLLLTPATNGATAAHPLRLGSFGPGRAVISSPGTGGITALDVAALRIENLVFDGGNPQAGGFGIAFIGSGPAVKEGIFVADVEIRNYSISLFVSSDSIPGGFRDIRLERLHVHGNGAGPNLFGHWAVPAAASGNHYGIEKVLVRGLHAHGNTGFGIPDSGAALVLMNARDVVVEDCVIRDNGGDSPSPAGGANGASAITIYDGADVVLQRNEIFHQRYSPTTQADNSGIDIWAVDSVVQYNYIHDNEGWGMTLGGSDPSGDPGANWPSERLKIRYNVFENNGRQLPRPKPFVNFMGAQLLIFGKPRDFDIHNNTFFSRRVEPPIHPARVEGMVYLYGVPGTAPVNIRLRNNIFVAGDNVAFVEVASPEVSAGLRFENNAYLDGPATGRITWGAARYDSLAAWSAATGQEPVVREGRAADHLCDPGRGGTRYPDPPGSLAAYNLRPGSPLIDAGLDLRALFGLDPGPRDFRGSPLPAGPRFDIGAHEWRPGDGCP